MIKAIIFDCFGVLTKDWWVEFCESLPAGPVLDKAKELNQRYDAGLMSLDDFIKALVEATGHKPRPIEAIFAKPEIVKNEELLSYIGQLSKKYKIGMISNIGTNWVREVFLTKEEQELFDDMLFSYEAGTTKPDPKIYEMEVERLGVRPEECVFIDDQPRYAEAAEAVGMKGIAYQDFKQMKNKLEEVLARDGQVA